MGAATTILYCSNIDGNVEERKKEKQEKEKKKRCKLFAPFSETENIEKQEIEKIENENLIKCMIVDSPFTSIEEISLNVASSQINLPRFIISMFVSFGFGKLKNLILNEENFDISTISPKDNIHFCKIPSLFFVGIEDTLIPFTNSSTLYKFFFFFFFFFIFFFFFFC